MNTKQQLKALAAAKRGVIVPGAFNALSAKVIADLGYEAIYITGAGVTNMWFAMPDQGFMGLHEIAEHTARIRDVVVAHAVVVGLALLIRTAAAVSGKVDDDEVGAVDLVQNPACAVTASNAVQLQQGGVHRSVRQTGALYDTAWLCAGTAMTLAGRPDPAESGF